MKLRVAILLSLMVCAFGSTSYAQAVKPNIVLMGMDNLGWGEIGVYGGGILRGAETPRLDQLAAGYAFPQLHRGDTGHPESLCHEPQRDEES